VNRDIVDKNHKHLLTFQSKNVLLKLCKLLVRWDTPNWNTTWLLRQHITQLTFRILKLSQPLQSIVAQFIKYSMLLAECILTLQQCEIIRRLSNNKHQNIANETIRCYYTMM